MSEAEVGITAFFSINFDKTVVTYELSVYSTVEVATVNDSQSISKSAILFSVKVK